MERAAVQLEEQPWSSVEILRRKGIFEHIQEMISQANRLLTLSSVTFMAKHFAQYFHLQSSIAFVSAGN